MAKRIYRNTVLKWAAGAGISGGTLIGLYFLYLTVIGAIVITGSSGDTICAGTIKDPCYAFVNFTAKEDIFIYPLEYDPYNRNVGVNFDPNVKSWKLERSWGSGWREVDFTTNCKGTWCGASDSSGNTVYSFAFRKDRNYQMRITALKENPGDTIKWSAFGVDPYFFGLSNDSLIKEYNSTSKEISFKSKIDNKVIIKFKLETEIEEYIIRGKDRKVAQYTITNNYGDYPLNLIIGPVEFIDLKKNQIINRTYYYEKKVVTGYENISVYSDSLDCKTKEDKQINGSTFIETCEPILIGTKQVEKYGWIPLDISKDMPKGKITIALVTDVYPEESIEWIPTFNNIKSKEWAVWIESLNTGLVEYWDFEQGTGTIVVGQLNRYNMTSNSSTWPAGKGGTYAMNFSFSASEFARTTTNITQISGTNFTINGWIKLNTVGKTYAGTWKIGKNFNLGDGTLISLFSELDDLSADVWLINIPNTQWVSSGASSATDVGTWVMMTMMYDTVNNNLTLWRNGVLRGAVTITNDPGPGELWIAKTGQEQFFPAVEDEISLYNRTLNSTEMLYLYDGGTGTFRTTIAPYEIALLYPVNNSNTSLSSVVFSLRGRDVDSSTDLIVRLWGNWTGTWHNNATNSSALNNTQTNFSVAAIPQGKHIYSGQVTDTGGLTLVNTTNITFTVDRSAPNITLPFYSNGTIKKSTNTLTLNISVSDTFTSPSACKIDINGTNQTVAVSSGWCNITNGFLTNLADGSRTINVHANDTLNIFGRNNSFIVRIDNTIPYIAYNPSTEANLSYLSRTWALVNITTTDTNLNDTRLSWNNVNQTFASSSGSNYWQNKTSLAEGNHSFFAWANDTAGNINFTGNRTVTIDTTIPLISFVSPTATNGTIFNRNWIYMKVSITETNFKNLTFYLYYLNNTQITSVTFTNSTREVNITSLANDLYFYNATTFDLAGNTNSTETRQISLITSINVYFENLLGNISAETGNITIKANGTGNVTICFDIDGPQYNKNYFCGAGGTSFMINPNFTKILFSNGSQNQVFNYSSLSYGNIIIDSHKYDEFISVKMNISGLKNPAGVIFFYANSTPDLTNSTQYIPLIDRRYEGYLNGSVIYLNFESGGNSTYNLTYQTGTNNTIYFVLDDIVNGINPYYFYLNVSGFLFGVDYKIGNNILGYYGFTNYSDIDTIQSTTHLDGSGVPMAKNVSRQMYYYDDFEDGVLNQTLWANTSCVIGPPTTCSRETNGFATTNVLTIDGTTIVGTFLKSRYNSLNFIESDIVNISINGTTIVQKFVNEDGDAYWVLLYAGVTIWESNATGQGLDIDEQTYTSLIIQLTKINRTTIERRMWGYENKTTIPLVTSSKYMFSGEAKYLTITNNSAGIYLELYAGVAEEKPDIIIDTYIKDVNHTRWVRNYSTVISNSIYDSSGLITSVYGWAWGENAPNETMYSFISADNGLNWKSYAFDGSLLTFDVPGNNLRWKVEFNFTGNDINTSASKIYQLNLSIPSGNVTNLTFDWGDDGIIDQTISGQLNSSNSPQLINLTNINLGAAFNESNRLAKSSTLNYEHTFRIPLKIGSATVGTIQIDNINLTYNPNPVRLNSSNLSNILANSTGNQSSFRFPISAINSSASQGQINITNLIYGFLGGRYVLNVTAHDTNYTINVTRNLTLFYSRWDYSFMPLNVNFIEFIPAGPTSKNVSAFGQTNSTPILNITNYGYGRDENDTRLLNGLIGHYKLNINSTTQLDSSPFQNNGTVFGDNGTMFTTTGKINGAYTFDGSNDYIKITRTQNLNFTIGSSYTVSFWFLWNNGKCTGAETDCSLTENWFPTTGGYAWAIRLSNSTKRLSWAIYNGTTSQSVTSPSTLMNDSSWHQVIFMNNGTDLFGYIGNTFIGSTKITITGNLGSNNYTIASRDASSRFFNGTIDDFRIYNRKLSHAEISLLYNSGAGTEMQVDSVIRNATLSAYLNGTNDCVNVTIGLNNSKIQGRRINQSWINLKTLSYLNNQTIWLWADYQCSYQNWTLFNPNLYFRACASGTNLCSESLI